MATKKICDRCGAEIYPRESMREIERVTGADRMRQAIREVTKCLD